jgi:hypothetical protein
LNRENDLISGADTLRSVEGKTGGRASASAWTTRRGRRPWHVRKLFAREPGDLAVGQQFRVLPWSASGRRGAVADDEHREKSHSATVAGKPTNNASVTNTDATEPAEPRAGTKRNASAQSTHRTQGRERVSQALDRVRKAARQRRKEKFTALLHHVSVDLLREAFFALKRDAAPGVDGMTWED